MTNLKFIELAKLFSEIEETSSRNIITQKLADFFSKCSSTEAQIITYLSLGTLRPPYIKMQFNLAEKTVKKIVARVLEKSIDWVDEKLKETGDLGELLRSRENNKSSCELSITEVYKKLEELELISGEGSVEIRSERLYDILNSVDNLSAVYIVKIVLAKLRLGFSDMTIIDALSWMVSASKKFSGRIEGAYNVCADLGLIAYTIKEDGIEGLDSIKPQLGIPIRPAAAERLPTPSAIIEKLGDCIAQPKLDGFRLQVHIKKIPNSNKHEVWFFSRNLIDMSDMFPDLVEDLKDLNVENVIFEGEAIGYDEQTGSFAPFQETVKRKRKHDIEEFASSLPLKLFVFDILYLNGKSLMNLTHSQRREIAVNLFKNNKNQKVSVIEEKKITTAEQLEKYFLENISAGLEGLVVKKPDSIYQPGKRNFNWIKLKRHEKGHLEDTIDAVVLGYYNGHGKRATFGIGAFLVGIYDPKNDNFLTVAKIGTGLKDEGWVELKSKCDRIITKNKPHNVDCPTALYPDTWVDPEIVVVVRADEITKSPLHSSGLALRFPRFVSYSIDKSPTQATSLHELKRLFEDQK